MRNILLCMSVFLSSAAQAAEDKACNPERSTIGVIVMDDGDLLRVAGADTFDYSADKGKHWKPLTTSGAWGTMDGRTLTVKDGRFISLK